MQIQGHTSHNGAKAKVVGDIVLICVVLHQMQRKH